MKWKKEIQEARILGERESEKIGRKKRNTRSKMATERGGMRGHERERGSEIDRKALRLREREVGNSSDKWK